MRILPAAAWVLASLACVGLAAAQPPDPLCIIALEPAPDFSRVTMRVDLVQTDSDRANLSRAVDKDRDGFITGPEVEAYEQSTYSTNSDTYSLGERKMLLDGNFPQRVTFHRDLRNVEGSAADRKDWVVAEVREYDFQPLVRDRYEVTGGLGAYETPRVAIETVVFTAPKGWAITRVNNTAYNHDTLTFKGFDVKNYYSVVFSRGDRSVEGSDVIPGVGLLAASVAVGVAAGATGLS